MAVLLSSCLAQVFWMNNLKMNNPILTSLNRLSIEELRFYESNLRKLITVKTNVLINYLIAKIRDNLKPNDKIQTSLGSVIVIKKLKNHFKSLANQLYPLSDIITIRRNGQLIFDTRIEAKSLSLPSLWRQLHRNSLISNH